MTAVLLLTHGGLARELLAAAETIAGRHPNMAAVSLEWSETPEDARSRVAQALADLDTAAGVLFLTDVAGGTPSNIAMEFRDPGRIEVVSGVNLPMVLRLSCRGRNGTSPTELSQWIREKGRSSICSPRACRPPGPCDPVGGDSPGGTAP